MFTTSLPMLPPPTSSLLPSLSSPTYNPSQQQAQHPGRRVKLPPPSTNTPLALLAQDERLIAQRKLAIAMYGWSWLKPAGCQKTMLGRKEEEIEREEVQRQLQEVEIQERMQLEIEEGERQRLLQAQARAEAAGEAPGMGEMNLDDDVPEAEEHDLDDDIPEDEGDEEEDEEDEERDLDDDVPEADVSNWHYDSRLSPDPAEGETGITDEVERSHLGGDSLQIPPMFHAGIFANEQRNVSRLAPEDEQAISNAMLEEDEMGDIGERDLDDEVPDADMEVDEEGWEHTDTELEESEMDISILPQQLHHQQPAAISQVTNRAPQRANITPATVESSIASSGRRSSRPSGNTRRNLFGRSNPGNAGTSLFTPPSAAPTSPVLDTGGEEDSFMRTRRVPRGPQRQGRRSSWLTPSEREN